MENINKIYNILKELAPLELAENWDNCGILIKANENIKNILISLDVTDDVIDEAIAGKCQLIISHHPVIFKGIKSIDNNDIVFKLIKNNISVISMHTNLDACNKGVNNVLSEKIGLFDIQQFENIGKIGYIDETDIPTLAKNISIKLNTNVKYVNTSKNIRTVAVIGGSGGSYIEKAKKSGAGVLIVGEASHHDACYASHENIGLIVAGHFQTEVLVLKVIEETIDKYNLNINTIISKKDKDPYIYLQNYIK